MQPLKLYMILLGCKPKGRHTEQHDIFFAVGNELKSTIPAIRDFWPEAEGKIHIDAWREVSNVNGFRISIVPKENQVSANPEKLFFLNLGGYRKGEFEEPHYKMLAVASEKAAAIRQAKESAFYQHTGFQGAVSHIDDKYGVDVDDVFEIEDILPPSFKSRYGLSITRAEAGEDELHLGYLPLSKLL